jgi:hypothetical protein
MLLLLLWILVMLLPITAIEQAWDQQSRSCGLLLQAMSGSVPEQIETSGQGANDVSPGGLSTGALYRTAQEESQTTNNNHSIVSESTLHQEPTRTRTSAWSSRGRNHFREQIDL